MQDMVMTDAWPPPGHRFSYRVAEQIEGACNLTFDLTVPKNMAVDLSAVRVGRHGGPNAEDLSFRDDLFRMIGSITVAGGHVEAAMKRLLVLLLGRSDGDLSAVDYLWSELQQRLLRLCDDRDQRRRDLREVLEWAEREHLQDLRNTAVHGSWWLFSGCGARVSRWPRTKKDGPSISHVIPAELAQFEEVAEKCWELATRLDDLLAEDWSRAMLPAEIED